MHSIGTSKAPVARWVARYKQFGPEGLLMKQGWQYQMKRYQSRLKEIEEYIDCYNNRRIKCKLKGLSPVQYRVQSQRVA